MGALVQMAAALALWPLGYICYQGFVELDSISVFSDRPKQGERMIEVSKRKIVCSVFLITNLQRVARFVQRGLGGGETIE